MGGISMTEAGRDKGGLAAHDWAGDAGARWLAQLDRFESMIEPVGQALLAQAGYAPGELVVDVGCGGGWTTMQIAAAGGDSGRAIGLDQSPAPDAATNDRCEERRLVKEGVSTCRTRGGP